MARRPERQPAQPTRSSTPRAIIAATCAKGRNIPYIAHVLGVTSLVLEYGGSDEQVAAALLHDVAEDHGGRGPARARSGRSSARRSHGSCGSALTASRPIRRSEGEVEQAKEAVREAPRHCAADALLVSCADKLLQRAVDVGGRSCDRSEGVGSVQRWPEEAGPELPCPRYRVLRSHAQGAPGGHRPRAAPRLSNELELEAAKAR